MLEGNKLGDSAGLTDIVNDLGDFIVARISMAGSRHPGLTEYLFRCVLVCLYAVLTI